MVEYPKSKCNCYIISLPFKGDDHGDKDGAADCDVIERVEELGEEERIELSGVWEGPVEDSGHAVVKQAEDKEDVVKTSKNY